MEGGGKSRRHVDASRVKTHWIVRSSDSPLQRLGSERRRTLRCDGLHEMNVSERAELLDEPGSCVAERRDRVGFLHVLRSSDGRIRVKSSLERPKNSAGRDEPGRQTKERIELPLSPLQSRRRSGE